MTLQTSDIKLFVEDVVPRISSVGTFNLYKKNKNKWLKSKFQHFQKKHTKYKTTSLTPMDLKKIILDVDLQYSISSGVQGVSLANAVSLLSEGKLDINAFYRKIGIQRLMKEPTVWYGPSTSAGHYKPHNNRIYIDIRKNRSLKERLKTLEFEVVNASHRDFRNQLKTSNLPAEKKAWESIKLEYQVSKLELKKLLRAKKVSSAEELVTQMGITQFVPDKYRITPPMYNKSKIKTDRIKMPGLSELSDKDKRTALFWFLVRNWTDDQIIEEYAYRPHTPGEKESTLEQEMRQYQK